MGELRYREAAHGDAAFAADAMSAARPGAEVDPLVLRYEWAHPSDRHVSRWYVVERDAAPIGAASYVHPRPGQDAPRYGFITADLVSAHRSRGTLAEVLAEMERRVVGEGALTIAARATENDDPLIAAIGSLGYHEDRRGRRWELDLVAERSRIEAMTHGTRARMREQGIALTTLAGDRDPQKYRKVWRMSVEAEHDVPSTLPHLDETLDDYLRWIAAPDIHEDRFWIARAGDDIVGVSVLSYPPLRGPIGTAWTATARRVRGRGVARALKCETLVQAITLGVERVRTGNDVANDPILHINASMGYRPIPGSIHFLKRRS